MAATHDTNDANGEPKPPSLNLPQRPSAHNSSPPSKSKQRRRWFSAWGLLLAHAFACIGVALAIALAVNGYHALDDQSATHAKYVDNRLVLRVSDVTTLVSAALVIVKLFVSWWTTLAVFACARHLFPEAELPQTATQNASTNIGKGKTREIEPKRDTKGEAFLYQWKLPPWFKPPFRLPDNISGSWRISFALLLGAVQVLIAPLLSGAINWTSISVPLNNSPVSVAAVSPQADFGDWYWYNYPYTNSSYGLGRRPSLRTAAGYAGLAWSDHTTVSANGTSLTGNGCRHVVTNNNAVGANSTLLNAVLPCIQVHDIQWYTPSNGPSRTQTNLVLEAYYLSIVNDDLFYYYYPGVAVAYDPENLWNNSQATNAKPEPVLFADQQTLWMLIQRQPWQTPPCTGMDPTVFGSVDSLPYYNYSTGDTTNSNCYFFALINYTAGVTVSPRSTYLSTRVVEDQTSPEEVVFEPNPWVQESLWLLPDLMTTIALMNSSLLPTYDNIDGYVEALLRQAYLAAWDMYHDSFDDDQIHATYTALPGVSRQVASVSVARIYGWLAICLLMTASGALLLAGVLTGSDLQRSDDERGEGKDAAKSGGWDIIGGLWGLCSDSVSGWLDGLKDKKL